MVQITITSREHTMTFYCDDAALRVELQKRYTADPTQEFSITGRAMTINPEPTLLGSLGVMAPVAEFTKKG